MFVPLINCFPRLPKSNDVTFPFSIFFCFERVPKPRTPGLCYFYFLPDNATPPNRFSAVFLTNTPFHPPQNFLRHRFVQNIVANIRQQRIGRKHFDRIKLPPQSASSNPRQLTQQHSTRQKVHLCIVWSKK